LEIFSYIIHTILWYKILVSTLEGQAKNAMVDIECNYSTKISFKCVIFRSEFVQKVFFLSEHCKWGTG
jgi:hypothetical protein